MDLTSEQKEAMKRVLEVLNRALKTTPGPLRALCDFRYPIPWLPADVEAKKFEDYPLVVLHTGKDGKSTYSVGLLGVLSGSLIAALELPRSARVCLTYDRDDNPEYFSFIEVVEELAQRYKDIDLEEDGEA